MKTRFNLILTTVFFALTLGSCSGDKKNEETVDLSQVTYQEFYEMIFEDYKNRVEWHNDRYNDEAKEYAQLIETGECETEKCGNQVFVKNSSPDQNIQVVVSTKFSIPNAPEYLATLFTLTPGEERYLTCTEFCFNGKTYKLDHEVVIAQYPKG